MKERWFPVGVLAGMLFVVNVVTRLVIRLTADGDKGADKQTWIGAVAVAVLGSVVLIAAVRWARRHPMPRVVGELALAAAVGCLLSAIVGPFVSDGKAFAGGFGQFLLQLFLYLAVSGFGGLFGVLGVMVAGADYKSQGWKRYAENLKTRPGRPVR